MNSLGGFQSPCGSSIHRCDFLPKSKIALHPRLDFRGSLFGDKSISLLRSAKRTTTMADTSSESATIGLNAVLSPCAITNSWQLITAFFLILWMVFLRRMESPAKVERFLPRIVEEMVKKEVEVRRALAIKRVLEGNEDENSKREYSLFCSKRGDAIFTQSWTPVNVHVRGLVVVMHGLNEHSGRYNDFAKKLNANGFKVYGMDWIGHGGSDGLHAYVHSVDYAVNDLKLFISKVLAENPGLPCFCFGHSTGGAIILKTMLDPEVRQRVKGIVLTSPAVGVQPSHPIFTVLAPLFSLLAPRFQLRAATRIGVAVCRDPQALVAKYSDLLVFTGSIRVRTGYEILRTAAFLQRNISSLTVPFLVLHGTSDSVTSPAASLKLYEASSMDKTIKLCEGLLHDLLFEPEKEEIMESIIEWLVTRC